MRPRASNRQLDQERRKLQNLIAAIEGGSGAPSSLLKAIADREGAIKKLEGEHRKAVDKPAETQLPDVPSWVEKQLRELTGVLKADPAKVKSEFRRLNLQFSFTPTEAEPRPHYIVKGQCELSALVFFYFALPIPGCGSGPIEGASGPQPPHFH
jgi:hypothetical protein